MAKLTGAEPYPSFSAVELSVRYMYFSCAKAREELGFNPQVDFKTSLRSAYNWYADNGFMEKF